MSRECIGTGDVHGGTDHGWYTPQWGRHTRTQRVTGTCTIPGFPPPLPRFSPASSHGTALPPATVQPCLQPRYSPATVQPYPRYSPATVQPYPGTAMPRYHMPGTPSSGTVGTPSSGTVETHKTVDFTPKCTKRWILWPKPLKTHKTVDFMAQTLKTRAGMRVPLKTRAGMRVPSKKTHKTVDFMTKTNQNGGFVHPKNTPNWWILWILSQNGGFLWILSQNGGFGLFAKQTVGTRTTSPPVGTHTPLWWWTKHPLVVDQTHPFGGGPNTPFGGGPNPSLVCGQPCIGVWPACIGVWPALYQCAKQPNVIKYRFCDILPKKCHKLPDFVTFCQKV